MPVAEGHWAYLRSDTNVVLLGPVDEDVPTRTVAAAARAVKAALAPEKVRLCVRLLPPVRMVLREDLDREQLIEAFNDLLKQSLEFLGATDEEIVEWSSYGMPDEYRGWLDMARRHAMKQLVKTDFGWGCIGDDVEESKTSVADEIVLGTAAASVSMRHTYATFDLALATAIEGLRTSMRHAGTLTRDSGPAET